MSQKDATPVSAAMKRAFLDHRQALFAFLVRLGAGDAAEDLLHEMWMRLPSDDATIHAPKQYLYRMAQTLLIDRERSRQQAARRDAAWLSTTGAATPNQSDAPGADRVIVARQEAARAFTAVAQQGERVARVFHRHRIDGLTQREVAAELGVSIGTIEGDLRRAYAALVALRNHDDEG